MTYEEKLEPKQFKESAHPVDRLAAFLVDMGFLSLLFMVALAPIRKRTYILEMTERADQILLLSFFGFCLLAAIGFLYRFTFTYFKGGTPGKLFFGLRVKDVWTGKSPTAQHIFQRELFWWFETFLFLIPHLGVYSHKHRRPLHDRMGETIVVSIKGRFAQAPLPVETVFARSLTAMVGSLVGIVIFFQSYSYLSSYGEGRSIIDVLSGGEWKCDSVSEAESNWPITSSRLEIALTLHGAGLIDDECIDRESRIALQYDQNIELAYLARAFITSHIADLSDAYLKEICDMSKNSEACRFSQVVVLWTEKKWDEATIGFEQMLATASPFVKVWAVKHFERVKNFEREEDLLEDLWKFQPLGDYLISHRVASLWGRHQKEMARIAFQSAQQMLPYDDALGLAAWYCNQSLKYNCGSKSVSDCSSIKNAVESEPSILESELFSVAYVKLKECEEGSTLNYADLESEMGIGEVALYVKGLSFLNQNETEEAGRIFDSILEKSYQSSVLIDDVKEQLVKTIDSKERLNELANQWMNSDQTTWTWRSLGNEIFNRSLVINDIELALKVGEEVFNRDPYNKELSEKLVVTNFNSGRKEEAYSFLKNGLSERAPASNNEYRAIVKKLVNEFGSP